MVWYLWFTGVSTPPSSWSRYSTGCPKTHHMNKGGGFVYNWQLCSGQNSLFNRPTDGQINQSICKNNSSSAIARLIKREGFGPFLIGHISLK